MSPRPVSKNRAHHNEDERIGDLHALPRHDRVSSRVRGRRLNALGGPNPLQQQGEVLEHYPNTDISRRRKPRDATSSVNGQ